MNSPQEIGILYLLPEEVANFHRDFRVKIEREFNLGGPTEFTVPSHIAMKYHFPVQNIEELENVIQDYCNSQLKTEWSLQGYDYFRNMDNFVIFMNVIPSQKTREAHSRLLDCLHKITWVQWGPYDHANLHYHVTLANNVITRANFDNVWSYINQQQYPKIDLFFDNLALIQINNGVHSIYKRYQFLDELNQN